jgi:hypothetical protein
MLAPAILTPLYVCILRRSHGQKVSLKTNDIGICKRLHVGFTKFIEISMATRGFRKNFGQNVRLTQHLQVTCRQTTKHFV